MLIASGLWLMPSPVSIHCSGGAALEQFLNLATVFMSWLLLRQPCSAPQRCRLGSPLSRNQELAALRLKYVAQLWRSLSSISFSDLSRAATKFENVSRLEN
eukprot:10128297-Heterocapsa_arctica.AAC.1